MPSAYCFLNYFKLLGEHGIPEGTVTYERAGFAAAAAAAAADQSVASRPGPVSTSTSTAPPATPWTWEGNTAPLTKVTFSLSTAMIEDSAAECHADFANRFVGGGCLENDFNMEEILFVLKPELIVAMALTSHMHDEEVVRISGALQFSCYAGYADTFEFRGDYDNRRGGGLVLQPPATVVAMDALYGAKFRQFEVGLVLRDLNKARLAFDGARTVATGNWGCGAFGNDHTLKFLQQWIACSDAGVRELFYHTHGDKRAAALPKIMELLQGLTVGELWMLTSSASQAASEVFPPPLQKQEFLKRVSAGP
jgi:hypothetical protein